jgi:hypothetical protein
MRLELEILAQAFEDVLRYELGLPLVGVSELEREYWYDDALQYLARHPKAFSRLKFFNKNKLLREVERARTRS